MAFSKTVFCAASVAALLVAGSVLTTVSAAPQPGSDEDIQSREADYGHFAEMLATVMLAREGGVEKALEAVPFLHDETHAYIKTVSLLAKNPALGDIKNWQGMSAKAALGVSKNYTSGAINDAVTSKFAAGQAAIEPIVNSIVPDALVNNAKANATTALLDKVGSAVAGPLNDDAFVDTLNAQLEKFNIRVTAKSVTAPSKFTPAAAVIARAATGVSLSATGVNFAPCLISIAPTGVSVGGQALNIAPVGIGIAPTGASIAAQGLNLQPVLILVQPVGGSIQPQGAQVAPFLIAVSPIGGNIQPQGAAVTPVDISVAPVGRAYVPQGAVVAPVHNAYAPVRINLTPPTTK